MQVAHVAPADLEFLFEAGLSKAKSRYHLVLAHVAKNSTDYLEFYSERVTEGHYVIVDNGAYEFGITGDFSETMDCVEHMLAQEIVLPDDMSSSKNTVAIFRDGLDMLRREYGNHYRPPYVKSFMIVPHGKHIETWKSCLREMLEVMAATFGVVNMPNICIGIAEKDGIALTGGSREPLVELVYQVWQNCGAMNPFFRTARPQIHLLGMTERLEEFHRMDLFEAVRGVDGSKLIVYGMSGLNVSRFVVREFNDATCTSSYPGRPDDYFFSVKWAKLTDIQKVIVQDNIQRWQSLPLKNIPRLEYGKNDPNPTR